jgi:hypothetical protein
MRRDSMSADPPREGLERVPRRAAERPEEYSRKARSRLRRDAPSYLILLYSFISFLILSANSARGTRTCSMLSRKRSVTVPFSLDS